MNETSESERRRKSAALARFVRYVRWAREDTAGARFVRDAEFRAWLRGCAREWVREARAARAQLIGG